MTISVREYEQLKAKVEKLQREADKAEGVHAEQMRRLRQDFNCKTLKMPWPSRTTWRRSCRPRRRSCRR